MTCILWLFIFGILRNDLYVSRPLSSTLHESITWEGRVLFLIMFERANTFVMWLFNLFTKNYSVVLHFEYFLVLKSYISGKTTQRIKKHFSNNTLRCWYIKGYFLCFLHPTFKCSQVTKKIANEKPSQFLIYTYRINMSL